MVREGRIMFEQADHVAAANQSMPSCCCGLHTRGGIGLDSAASSHRSTGWNYWRGLHCRFAIADMAAIMCHVLQAAESQLSLKPRLRSGFNASEGSLALHDVWSMDELLNNLNREWFLHFFTGPGNVPITSGRSIDRSSGCHCNSV